MALVLTINVSAAHATPAADRREQARVVKQQVDALDHEVSIAAEAFNEARLTHETLSVEISATRALIAEQNAVIESLQESLEVRAASMYRNGPLTFLEVLLGARDFEQFASVWDFLHNLNEADADNVRALSVARAESRKAEERLAEQLVKAKASLDVMAANKEAIERQLAERKRMLAGLEDEIARIEAAERARVEAEARAAAARGLPAWRNGLPSSGAERQFPPPTRAARSEVVNIAKRYLGAPYQWGASGPNRFDCSGFTRFVFQQVGVSLPHSSRAQFGSGERVSRSDLQPGDLVFWGNPIHHVGIYIGGGQFIHAPRTDDVVSIEQVSFMSNYTGAVRP